MFRWREKHCVRDPARGARWCGEGAAGIVCRMQRLVVALLFVACSSPAPAQPEPVKAAPEPPMEVKKEPAPEVKKEPEKPAKFADQAAVLATMPADVAALGDKAAMEAYMERVKGVPGIASAEVTKGTVDGFAVKFDPPLDAATLGKQFGWGDLVAVSGDAQQKTFALHVSKGEIEGSKGKKIATTFPRFGPFRVEARLVARPAGKLPKVSAGASPAYGLDTYQGSVNWLFFMRDG
jgi:hypothetical protein